MKVSLPAKSYRRVPLLSHMELRPSIGTYQTALLEYAFDAVRRSVQVSDGVASTSVPSGMAFKTILRLPERLPRLHQYFAPSAKAAFEPPFLGMTAAALVSAISESHQPGGATANSSAKIMPSTAPMATSPG